MPEKLIADHWRGLDFYSPQRDECSHAVIVGCGAIGSYVAFGLARMGVKKLTLIDFDTVEGHNIPNQFFAESLNLTKDVFKVNILSATIKLIVPDVEIHAIPLKWEEVQIPDIGESSAIFTLVDKMEIRREILESQYVKENNTRYLIDSRTGGLYANVFAIDLYDDTQVNFYKASLHTDEEAAPLPCSGQSIVDTSMCVAGELVGRYRTLMMNGEYPSIWSFHDYKTGQGWIQQINPNVGKPILTDDTITKVGFEKTAEGEAHEQNQDSD